MPISSEMRRGLRLLSLRLAFNQHRSRCKRAKQFHPDEENCQIVQLSNYRNEGGDYLDRTEEVAERASGNHFGAPRYIRMSQQQGDYAGFPKQELNIFIPLCRSLAGEMVVA